MFLEIRQAVPEDMPAILRLYDHIHTAEESGLISTGWIRNVYPVEQTASNALAKGQLFVLLDAGKLQGAAIINHDQHESYRAGAWLENPDPARIMVLHTLMIDPASPGKGYGRAFMKFYAEYALANDCPYLRMDTNAINAKARAFYAKLGFSEAGIVETEFNGIGTVNLVLLERLASSLASL